jgi:HK97 family phage major capsid protein
MLERLRQRVEAINARIRAINEAAEAETRNALTPEEETEYTELRAERGQLEARVTQLEDEEQRRAAAAAGASARGEGGVLVAGADGVPVGGARVLSEPTMYGRGTRQSYFLDLARYQIRGDSEAHDRLQRHAQELDVLLPAREARRAARAERQLESLNRDDAGRYLGRDAFFGHAETRVNPNRTDGQGGYFVPPIWLIDEYIAALRNGRPFMNLVRNMELPGGTDSINVPKVATGTTTATQLDAGTVSSTDLTDNFVTAPVRTIAGQQDIAMQLLDQSPVAFDEIVFSDLLDDYAQKVDQQGFIGTGASGQLKGLDNVSGVNAITYTDASPTLPELYPILAQAISQLAKNRKRADGLLLLMQGPRWYWAAAALDANLRPFIQPIDQGAGFNSLGLLEQLAATGPVGRVFGAPVQLDLNITTTDGAGTNQDRIYAVRPQDYYLWEGTPRTRALSEVLSGTLQVRLQLFNYLAFMPDRYPTATSIISGTGLIAPAGF